MSDLQAAATETTAKLTALLGETEQFQTSLQESQAQVSRVREQVEAVWTQLSDRAQFNRTYASFADNLIAYR